ncbi:MAG: tRNA (N(6)-L-threonylcarbamoyladenosine(37)-C(2))-methylthiotransferase MtaB [Clostridia bacterium]|nr:tRNA (N(6)-L-threonylcarbamoyladenosine(37)-C(2))-methylthiotransferase MtaB [Clostridia bacterium]
MTFFILTFGCKVNQCESENIQKSMEENSFEACESFEKAEIVLLNSCAVTGESVRKLRQSIHKIKHKNPNCILAVTGCVAQAESDEISKMPEVDIIIGNANKSEIPSIIKRYLSDKRPTLKVDPIFSLKTFPNEIVNYSPHRSRAFLKIEDGCNRFCSYCIIPYARGRVRSKNLADIENDVKLLAKNGYKEVVLVGINLSSYGMDIGKNLADAVSVVCSVDGIERVRLSSLEPDLMTDEILLRLSKEPKLCHQFHLALQSGSNKILSSMRRRYNREEYIKVAHKIKAIFPNATFTTDLMVGFPEENETDFKDSLDLIEEVGFLKVHVFPYSVRPGTLAETFDGQIPKAVKAKRVHEVMEKSSETCQKVLKSFVGKMCDVLYETRDADGLYEGYTKEYVPVKTKSPEDLRGKIIPTKMGTVKDNYILCEYI